MFMPGGVGLLGADIDAWDVAAPRGAGAAIVMVVAVSADWHTAGQSRWTHSPPCRRRTHA
jgi:hypothetical protein